jgi:hypothetical protein
MRKLILLPLFLLSFAVHAQIIEEIATQVAQDQLIAYNNKDITNFMALFATDASIHNFGDCTPIAEGKEAIKNVYKKLFESSPNLHSQVINRTVLGNQVLDYELITGRENNDSVLKIIAIYEIENSLIKKATFIRE